MKRFTIQEITKLTYDDIKHLSKEELLDLTKQATKYSKSRQSRYKTWYKNQEDKYGKSQAYRDYGKEEHNFNININKVKEKTGRAYLLNLFTRARKFLISKTSTASGFKESLKKFKKTIEEKANIKNFKSLQTSKGYSALWNIYNKLKSISIDWRNLDSSQAVGAIITEMNKYDKIDNNTSEEIISNLTKRADNVYEEYIKNTIDDFEDNEDFFTLDW